MKRIKADFPTLNQEINGHPLTYLDSAATSQKPRAVTEALTRYYALDNANVHRGIHELSRRATDAYEAARVKVASWIGADDSGELVWTSGTTEAINLIATAWGLDNMRPGDEILLTTLEHHSNLVPWQLLAARTGSRLRYLEMDGQGRLDLEGLAELLGDRTKVFAFGHVSNALGTVNPVTELARAAKAAGALVVVDGAQGVVHADVNVGELAAAGVDCYAFSGHKMCGPTGIGCLWAKRELLETMNPYKGGGEMISVVERDASAWAEVPHKFEAGTPNIAGAIGMAAAVDYLAGLDRRALAGHERDLISYAMERVSDLEGARVYGPAAEERAAILSFTLGDAHPHDISTILDSRGVAIRAGNHCAQLVMRHYGVAATARASFYLYNDRDDVDRLVEGLYDVQEIFG